MLRIVLISLVLVHLEFGVGVSANNNTRIIGGIIEAKVKYYEVAIVSAEDDPALVKVCTGALVGNRWVLTSAYCATRKDVLTVQYGTNSIDISGNLGYFVQRKFVHPNYNPNTLIHDIALLEINPIQSSTGIKILTIPVPTSDNYLGKLGKVSGWGATESHGSYETTLYSKQVSVTQSSYCEKKRCVMKYYKLCAEGRSICEGDEGAPLVIADELVGVASGALELLLCADMISVPFTRVSYYSTWLRYIMMNN